MEEYQQALLFDDYRDWKHRCKLEKRLSSIYKRTNSTRNQTVTISCDQQFQRFVKSFQKIFIWALHLIFFRAILQMKQNYNSIQFVRRTEKIKK
ncbi:TPA: hypothetical protein ACOQ41_005452 [Bacillus cereus]